MSRQEGRRLLELLALTGLAVTQPVLDVLGQSPETFLFRGVGGWQLVVFAVLVAVVPALVIWGVGLAVGRAGRSAREWAHRLSLGALVAVAVVVAAKSSGLGHGPLVLVVGLLLGVGLVVLYVRSRPVSLFLCYLSALPLLAVVLFLTASPTAALVRDPGYSLAEGVASTTPVVWLVLDEFPTAAILDEDGLVDAERYPNLALLSEEGTWFRNYSAVNNFTQYAVPSMLSGQDPVQDAVPAYWDHPENLFTLLGGTYDMTAIEAITQMCPTGLCAAGSDQADAGIRAVTADALEVARGLISLDPLPETETDTFAEEVPKARDVDAAGSTSSGFNVPVRFEQFLDGLEEGDEATVDLVHLVLPHEPWRLFPDGTEYVAPLKDPRGDPDGVWAADWPADLNRLRFDLQARYVDRLVGLLVDRLQDTGLWDRAVVVVAADHGASFLPGEGRRVVTEANAHEILWSTLFVRAPGLEPGVNDVNVQSTDVLPTVIDLLGVESPWAVDGHSVVGLEEDDEPAKRFFRMEALFDPGPEAVLDLDGPANLDLLLTQPRPVFAGEDPVGAFYTDTPLGELYHQDLAALDVGGSLEVVAEVDRLDDLVEGTDGPLPALVRGRLEDEDVDDDAWFVLAVDGQVVGFSPLYIEEDDERGFALLLAPGDVGVDGNEVEAFVVDEPGGPLRPIELAG